jgi:hypothetical protein
MSIGWSEMTVRYVQFSCLTKDFSVQRVLEDLAKQSRPEAILIELKQTLGILQDQGVAVPSEISDLIEHGDETSKSLARIERRIARRRRGLTWMFDLAEIG